MVWPSDCSTAYSKLRCEETQRCNCRGGPPWPPVSPNKGLFQTTGGHRGPPLQNAEDPIMSDKTWITGEFVETVQLQVVCQTLINKLAPDATEISMEHLEA